MLEENEFRCNGDWLTKMLGMLHADIPGSHDLLIALILMRDIAAIRKQAEEGVPLVLSLYEAQLEYQEDWRAITFFTAAMTQLKAALETLKRQPSGDREKALARLSDYFGESAETLDTSFSHVERVYLLSNPLFGKYWKHLKLRA